MGKINYGFGKEYLPNWTIKEALREVLQNYIDYGDYKIDTKNSDNENNIIVTIINDYAPDKLEFLRIGNSDKGNNSDAIGHHGEGLKMAFLIFLRENLKFTVRTRNIVLNPKWSNDPLIGETLCIEYDNNKPIDRKTFGTQFECPKNIYDEFINDIITDDDIIHSTYNGDIVDRPDGNIYSGNLFVCNIPKLSNAYNIKPCNLKLDRDRSIPSDWDIQYYTSKILQSYNNHKQEEYKKSITPHVSITTEELEGKDYSYVDELPDNIVNQFNSRKIGTKNVYINKVDNKHIQNRRITDILDKHPKFTKDRKVSARQQLKYKTEISNKKSINTLLKNFKNNYCNSKEMKEDITIIINRYNKDIK